MGRVVAQTIGERAPGGAGANDDEVVSVSHENGFLQTIESGANINDSGRFKVDSSAPPRSAMMVSTFT
jgi:hypothetical protein